MTVFAGQWGPEPFIDLRGNAVPSATIAVYLLDGVTPATLYTSRTKAVALANPLPIGVPSLSAGLDDQGNGTFFADPAQYVMAVSWGGGEVYRGIVTVPTDALEEAADNIFAAVGDLLVGTGLGTETILPVGAAPSGRVLTVDLADGLKIGWRDPTANPLLANVAYKHLPNAFTVGGQTITAEAAGVVPLYVKGAPGQTAAVFQGRDSTGAVTASLSAAGALGLSGALTLPADPTLALQATTKQYVDAGDTTERNRALAAEALLATDSLVVHKAGNETITGVKTFSVGGHSITAEAVGVVPLFVKGSAGQTGNLFEARDSTGAIKSHVRSDGALSAPVIYLESGAGTNSYLQQSSGIIISGAGGVFLRSTVSANLLAVTQTGTTITPHAAGVVGLTVKGVVSQSADLQQWLTSTGSVLGEFLIDGTMYANYLHAANQVNIGSALWTAKLSVNLASTAQVGQIIKLAVGATADALQIQDSTGASLVKFAPTGALVWGAAGESLIQFVDTGTKIQRTSANVLRLGGASNGLLFNSATRALTWDGGGGLDFGDASTNGLNILNPTLVVAGAADRIPLVVRGFAAQTANIQEWRDSTSAVLAKISSVGAITALSITVTSGGAAVNATGDISSSSGRMSIGASSVAFPGYSRGSDSDTGVHLPGANALSLVVGGVEQVQVTSTGLGIGMTPSYPLDVLGHARVSGNVYGGGYVGTAGGYIGYAGGSPSSQIVNIAGASAVALQVKGAASQSGDLSQWVDSTGAVLAKIDSAGGVYTSTFANAANTGPYMALPNAAGTLGWVLTNRTTVGNTVLTVDGMAGQTGDLQRWRNSAGTALSWVTAAGKIVGRDFELATTSNTYGGGSLGYLFWGNGSPNSLMVAGAAGHVPLVVKAAAAQTADLLQAQDSTGAVKAKVTPAGAFASRYFQDLNGGTYLDTGVTNYGFQVVGASAATQVPIAVRGFTAQSADLEQWMDVSSTVLARISASGGITVKAATIQSGAFITPNGAAAVALEVRGAAAQTGDLLDLTASSGAVLSRFDSVGKLGIGVAPISGAHLSLYDAGSPVLQFVNSTTGSTTSDGVKLSMPNLNFYIENQEAGSIFFRTAAINRLQIGATGTVTVNGFGAGDVGLIVKLAVTPTASAIQVQDSTGAAIAAINETGRFRAANGTAALPAFSFVGDTDTGIYWESANQFRLGVAGAAVASVTSSGLTVFSGMNVFASTVQGNAGSDMYVTPNGSTSDLTLSALGRTTYVQGVGAAAVRLVVLGAAAQSADEQQWRDSTSAVVLRVTAAGALGGVGDTMALFGGTKRAQPARAGQLTDNSGGVSGGNTIAAITVAPLLVNAAEITSVAAAIATLAARLNSLEDKISGAGTGIGVTA